MANAASGVTLGQGQAPSLMTHVQRLAQRLEGEPPHHVTLIVGTDMGIAWERKWWADDQARLSIGLASLYALSGATLSAVLAHELSHLKAGHVAKLTVMAEVRDLLDDVRTGEAGGLMQRAFGGAASRWFRQSAGYNREQELLADQMAAAVVGGSVMAASHAEVALRAAQYALFLEQEVGPALVDTPYAPERLGGGFASYLAAQTENEPAIRAALLAARPDADAAYPTLAERMAAVRDIEAQNAMPPPRGEPVTWVRDVLGIDAQLTQDALLEVGVVDRAPATWDAIHRARVDAEVARAKALRAQVLQRLNAAEDVPGPAAVDAVVHLLNRSDAVSTLIALHDVDADAAKAMQAQDPAHVEGEARDMLADVFAALFLAEAEAAGAPLRRDFAGLWAGRRPLVPFAQEAARSLSPGQVCLRFRASL